MTEVEELRSSQAKAETFTPGPVLLLGAPGVGKGTQAQALMGFWSVPQVSTGDLIRENIRLGTAVGREFGDLVAKGVLVPDDLVNRMVAARIVEADCRRGYILDGFPRTLGQAEWLDAHLAGRSSEDGVPGLALIAVNIKVRYDELLRRITGRRTGPVSKRIYNIYTNPPLTPGVCDVDGEPLVQRPDDTEEVFADRLKTFDDLTAPVIQHYRGVGRFEEVDGEQDVDAVTASIIAALRRLRRN